MIDFHNARRTAPLANSNQAAETDLATVLALVNELRTALIVKGLIKDAS